MEQYINNAPFALVIVFLIIGFVFLIKGADFFVEGSSSIAKKLKVPSIIIGLTIVAMGTSLPETAVSVTASLVHNILMVLGIASAISPVSLISENVIDILVLVGFSVVVWFFARSDRKITRNEGIAMVAMYLIYTAYIIMR